MAFDSGSLSFRIFYLQQRYDSALLEQIAGKVIQPIDTLSRDPLTGWVSGRHLFDRNICDATCLMGPYLHAQLLHAEKRVPPALLRAHIKMEEDLELRTRSMDYLPRAVKAEIRQRVTEALQPAMPPTLTSIPIVVDFRNNLLLAGALSDKQIDTLSPFFRETAGTLPILLTPETAALKRKQVNAKDLEPVSFSPDLALDPPLESTLGMDFLTWLWFAWEKEGGVFHLPDGREFGIMLEGPITFFREGKGAHEALLRKGSPLNSSEAITALCCGKKLKRVKVVLAHGDEIYSAALDADFAFRSLKLPKSEQPGAEGRFEERMLYLETFWSAWLALFDRFLDLRVDPKPWQQTLTAMRAWIGRGSN